MADDSILNGTKRALGIEPGYKQFDPEIIMHINAAFGVLNQIGVGPVQGFDIEDDEPTWSSFLKGDARFNPAKQYVYQKVRLAFDPPSTSFVIASMEKNLAELEYRLNLAREMTVYGLPEFGLNPGGETTPPDGIYDGGNPDGSTGTPNPTPQPNDGVYDGGSPGSSIGDEIYDGGTPDGSQETIPPVNTSSVYDGGTPGQPDSGTSNTVYDGGSV